MAATSRACKEGVGRNRGHCGGNGGRWAEPPAPVPKKNANSFFVVTQPVVTGPPCCAWFRGGARVGSDGDSGEGRVSGQLEAACGRRTCLKHPGLEAGVRAACACPDRPLGQQRTSRSWGCGWGWGWLAPWTISASAVLSLPASGSILSPSLHRILVFFSFLTVFLFYIV